MYVYFWSEGKIYCMHFKSDETLSLFHQSILQKQSTSNRLSPSPPLPLRFSFLLPVFYFGKKFRLLYQCLFCAFLMQLSFSTKKKEFHKDQVPSHCARCTEMMDRLSKLLDLLPEEDKKSLEKITKSLEEQFEYLNDSLHKNKQDIKQLSTNCVQLEATVRQLEIETQSANRAAAYMEKEYRRIRDEYEASASWVNKKKQSNCCCPPLLWALLSVNIKLE